MLDTVRDTEAGAVQRLDPYQVGLSHSRRVRRLKILLPVLALIVSLIFISVSLVRAYLPDNVSVASATIENGQVVMETPAISGRNAKGVSYSMTADRALQDIKNPSMITLQNIKAAVPMSGDSIARVVAKEGIYDRTADKLDMVAPFTILLDNGIDAQFQSAKLDIKSGLMISEQPVKIQAKQALIVAQTLKITDKGDIVVFEGKVRVNVDSAAINNQGK